MVTDRPGRPVPLYVELSAAGLFAGSGLHVLDPGQLGRFRDAVDAERSGGALEDLVAAARAAGLEVFGQALKTAPRGVPRDHPRVALLRHRALFAGRRLGHGPTGIAAADALAHVRGTWAAAAGLERWIDEHVGAADAPPGRR